MKKTGFEKLDVLVVDPSPHMTGLVAQMLRHLRVRSIDEATTADAATLRLHTHRYGAVIVNDELLPVDGIDLISGLRQASAALNRDVAVIMISSSPDAATIARARDAGVTEFLRKPFAPSDVAERLAATLAAPRPFIEAEGFAGPDRRRRKAGFDGTERRAPKRQA